MFCRRRGGVRVRRCARRNTTAREWCARRRARLCHRRWPKFPGWSVPSTTPFYGLRFAAACFLVLMLPAGRTSADGAAQHREKLLDANFVFLWIAGMREQAGIEFFGEQRVLEALNGPFEHRSDQRGIDVSANFPARQSEAHGRG